MPGPVTYPLMDKLRHFVLRMGAKARKARLNRAQPPLMWQSWTGAGFLGGKTGQRIRPHLPKIALPPTPGIKQTVLAVARSPWTRRLLIPGVALGGVGAWGASNLDADAQAHIGPIRFHGLTRATEKRTPGHYHEGMRASARLNFGRGMTTGIAARQGRVTNAKRVSSGRVGAYLRSRPVGLEAWVKGSKVKRGANNA